MSTENRRPLKSRQTAWAQKLAARIAHAGIRPDEVSGASVGFAALGALLFVLAGVSGPGARAAELVGAAACIQLRLICNLLDGMVAVEHGRGSPSGPIWNELPDRVADGLLLVGAGYCAVGSGIAAGGWLGWLAAFLAVLTAYVRELGRGLGFPADFSGPMAKPQRMAALTLISLIAAIELAWGWRGQSLVVGLVVIAAGAAWTVARRTRTLAGHLAEKAKSAP
jgi:phosphatidylglycerophosphate synthase